MNRYPIPAWLVPRPIGPVLLVALLALFYAPAVDAAESPCRQLAEVPAKPAPDPQRPYALYAGPSGYLYCQAADKAYGLAVEAGETAWLELPLDGLVDLTSNTAGEVFARCKDQTTTSFYRLCWSRAISRLRQPGFEDGPWYVDAVGRVWLQPTGGPSGKNRDDLIVLQRGEPPRVIKSPLSNYGRRIRRPCEYKPGHLVLFHNTSMIWATPDEVTVRQPPRFAADGTGKGPLVLGDHFLLSGGSNNEGMGSYLIDTPSPDQPPRRLSLGWSWFHDVASAPDGRALVRAQTDRNPKFTLFWYAPDGRSQTQLEGADDVLRAGISGAVCFDRRNNGYAALKDGTLAVFEADRARVITPFGGLPVEKLVAVAMLGDQLAMLGPKGHVVLWDTRVGLQPETAEAYDRRGEWRLAGPCCIDAAGNLWAFLADFPGHLSRFDGNQWHHRKIELGKRKPFTLTADDLGNLQLGFYSAPAGSDLITPTGIESWGDRSGFVQDGHMKAWHESVRRGATRFFNGSTERTRHWTNGGGKVWLFEGRILWDGAITADYYDRPPYSRWWADPDGTWVRDRGQAAAVYRTGRWCPLAQRPSRWLLGPNGLRSYDPAVLEEHPQSYLPVASDSSDRLFAHGPHSAPPTTGDVTAPFRQAWLGGNEVFVPIAAGGGWVGQKRYFRGVFFEPQRRGKVYEAAYGRFFLDGNSKVLTFYRHVDPKVTADVDRTPAGWTVRCRVEDVAADEPARLLVFVNGEAPSTLETSTTLDFPLDQHAGAEIEIWATDAVGNVSRRPAAFRLTREADDDRTPPPPFGRGPRPRWTILPKQVTAGGESYQLGDSLAIAGDGTVFVTGTSDPRRPAEILAFHPQVARWMLVPAGPDQHATLLTAAPDGRVYAMSRSTGGKFEAPVYAVTRSGLTLCTHIYDDTNRGTPRFAWDDRGNLWNLGMRWIGRWDGTRWTQWERPVGWNGQVRTAPGGQAVVFARERFWTFTEEKLDEPRPLPDGWIPEPAGFPLGHRWLLLRCRSKAPGSNTRWGLLDLADGTLDVERFASRSAFRPDGRGNLVAWDRTNRQLQRISGSDLSVQSIPYPYDDSPSGSWGPTQKDFLVTRGGTMFLAHRDDGIITWTAEEGMQKHDWHSGIQAARTSTLGEDPDGRVWILRRRQLVVYDPQGDPGLNRQPYEDWREIATLGGVCPGFHGKLWYWKRDKSAVASTDGENETTWQLNQADYSAWPSIEVVSDLDEALTRDPQGRILLLHRDGSTRVVDSLHAGVLEMVKRGAKTFRARGYPPVVAADGSVYYDGQLYDGTGWKPTHKGRAFLDALGRLMLITGLESSRTRVYRFQGGGPEEMETPTRYLIDSEGLRWYDPGVMEATPGRFPIVTGREQGVTFSLGPDGKPCEPTRQAVIRAIAAGNGEFLVETRYGGLHHLGPQGFRKLDALDLPFGDQEARLHQVANGRWAWIFRSAVFVSPPGFRFAEGG